MGNSGKLKSWENLKWDIERFGLSPNKLACRLRTEEHVRPLFTTSMPKSGTHLLERVLCLYPSIYRVLAPTLNPENIEKKGGWGKFINGLSKGKLLVTHAHFDTELAALLAQAEVRTYLMVRDPRAMVLSDAHYLLKDTSHRLHPMVKNLTLNERIDFCIDAQVEWQSESFVTVMKRFLPWIMHEGTLVVRFEDLVSEDWDARMGKVKQVLEHAGAAPSPVVVEEITRQALSSASPTYRSGKINEWKDVLTSDQVARIKGILGDSFAHLGYDL